MLQYDFEDSVGCWVAATAHVMRRALDAELATENITFRQWEVLAWLSWEQRPVSQSDLADRMNLEPPTLAGVISRMERDGWLERTGCTEDRRRKLIQPTPKAESVWTAMVECCKRVRARASAGISAEDLATLKRICESIRENLDSSSVALAGTCGET